MWAIGEMIKQDGGSDNGHRCISQSNGKNGKDSQQSLSVGVIDRERGSG